MGQKSGPKTQKLDKSGILPVFNSFWPKKGIKCFFNLNFKARFGILSSFSNIRTTFAFIFTF